MEPTLEELKAQLLLAKQEAHDATALLAKTTAEKDDLTARIAAGNTAVPIPGSYKGHRFADNHRRIRTGEGKMADTAALLAAAADKESEGHAEAVAHLDRLIELKYAFFTKPVTAKGKQA